MKAIAACLLALASATNAAVIAHVIEGDLRLELHDEAGPCLGEARLAVFYQGPQRIPGCWKLRPPVVSIVFMDGDLAQVSIDLFKRPEPL